MSPEPVRPVTLAESREASKRIAGRSVRTPERAYPGTEGAFVHPFDDHNFIAGHATMGLELLEDAPAQMWHRMQPLLDGCIVVLRETERAMRLMAETARVISEGAALPLAAALTGNAGQGPIVAIVSGGNSDLQTFAELKGGAA